MVGEWARVPCVGSIVLLGAAQSPVGNDYVEIKGSGNTVPPSTLAQGSSYTFVLVPHFFSGSVSSASWKLKLYHDGGDYELQNGSGTWWSPTINSLPGGYHWKRDAAHRVTGYVIVNATRSPSGSFEAVIPISIDAAPLQPSISVSSNIMNCSNADISFYAAGTDFYNFYYRELGSAGWWQWNVPGDQTLVQLTGLDQGKTYEFMVEAFNDYGSTQSIIRRRSKCLFEAILAPNPMIAASPDGIVSTGEDGDILIDHIEVVNVQTSQVMGIFNFPGDQSSVPINLPGISTGNYTIIVTSTEGTTATINMLVE